MGEAGRGRLPPGRIGIVNQAAKLALDDHVAELDRRLEQTVLGRVDKEIQAAQEHQARAGLLAVAERAGGDAAIIQQTTNPGLGDFQDRRGDLPAAAQLRADMHDVVAQRAAGQGLVAALHADREEADRRAEQIQHFDHLIELLGILVLACESAGDVVQRTAAGMQIEGEIGAGQQFAFDVMRDLHGRRSVGIAGEAAVQIAVVDRRGAHPGHHRREIGRRQDDHPALDVARLQLAAQAHEGDLALVLVAVITGVQEHRRPLAVADHGDWDRDIAIGRAMDRMR